MDPIKVNKLIEEDSNSSRGINFNQVITSGEVNKELDLERNKSGKTTRNDREM